MSHHLDTPLASQNGQLYIDDLYVFQGNASTVFVMDVNSNITGVHVKPGFHTEAAAVDLSAWRPDDAKNSFANTTVDTPRSLT
jgi:hypothetical protein